MELSYKQYLITNHKLIIPKTIELFLNNDVRLYVGEGLSIRQGMTKGGQSYVVLGDAYCTDQYPRDVVDDLDSATDEDVYDITSHWTGRWVLIFDRELITDGCGLMSAFYHEDGNRWMVSSSIALVSRQLGLKNDNKVSTIGLTWSLLPSTIQKSVRLLFCTQRMTLNQSLEIHFCNKFVSWKDLSYDERVSTITQSLVTGLKNINTFSNRKTWIALTAGKDSRLTFAAALSAGVPFETYTARHRNMIYADRHLPEILSRKYGVKYHLLRKGKFSESKYKDYCVFSGFNSLGTDAEFYATSQFEQIPDNIINIKSGLFEAGQIYARKIAGGDENTFYEGIKNYYKSSFKDESQVEAFNEWMKYQRENPMPGIDIRDRFYLEQRLNGWASALEQSLDINPFVSIHIANSAVVLGSLLYATSEDRKDLMLSYGLIRALNPGLLDYPVNQQTLGDRMRIVINGLKKRVHL